IMESQVRMHYSKELEAAVNKQINIELYASYVYLSMSVYFDRDDVALPHISKFFQKQSEEERGHASKFMKMQNMRGGRAALALEKFNNQALLDLHAVATDSNDVQFTDFLESELLEEQTESINEMGKMVTNLKRVGSGLGEYMFDKEHNFDH
ncbi:ferritin-like protein, partial [Teladorsagia circumcincta]